MSSPLVGTISIRERHIGFLKQYNDHTFKLVHMNSVRVPGYELRGPSRSPPRRSSADEGEKLSNSLSRTRAHIYELSLCNPWEFFVTLTIDPARHNRYDLHGTYKRLSKWFNNYNSRQDANIRYLLVPEPHKDDAWHFHGLMFGLPLSHLTLFTLSDNIPNHIKDMLRSGRQIYNWPAYAASFGFVTVEMIQDLDRCAAYMTKYITKELQASSIELNHHLYYCSQRLKRAETLYRGPLTKNIESPDFENDYVQIKMFSSPEPALSYFCDEEC